MRLLFTAAIFFSAFLLFLVQPMLAKLLLPLVGGSPSLWVVTMLFFQLLLLAGYGYATAGAALLRPRSQWLLHCGLLGAAMLLALPLALHASGYSSTAQPELWVLLTLLATVGLPYFALSAQSSLIQRWYHHRFREEPYRLFSASNLGSLLGLLGYPFLVERYFPVSEQLILWSGGFILLALLLALLGLGFKAEDKTVPTGFGRALPWQQAARITGLAFVPSSLFLGVTLYVTTDIASLPLLWIIPLSLYLLSFILVFSRHGERWTALAQKAHVFALAAGIVGLGFFGSHLWLFAHFLFFFVIAVSCHGQLARMRPAPESLTRYYFWLSLGGMLGGLFNTLAPHLFDWVVEYPAVLILSVFALPPRYLAAGRRTIPPRKMALVGAGMAGAIAFIWLGGEPVQTNSKLLSQERNFFGVSKVTEYADYREYFHGTTTHGVQPLSEKDRLKPSSYYGPVFELMQSLPERFARHPMGVLGLGVGTSACAGRKGQEVDFFEINPAVIAIARNPDWFTYLRDCPPKVTVYQGDGRLELAKQPPNRYGLLVLDAYSSDAIPLHTVTREALAIYLARLVPEEGILAFNISNRHMNLAPFITRAAQDLGWQGYLRQYPQDPKNRFDFESEWLLLLPPESPWREPVLKARYKIVEVPLETPLWTDDYSNILPAIKWRKQ